MKYGIVSCVFTVVLKPQLQPEVANHCVCTVQTVLNFAANSFFCKITLIWLGSSLSVGRKEEQWRWWWSWWGWGVLMSDKYRPDRLICIG